MEQNNFTGSEEIFFFEPFNTDMLFKSLRRADYIPLYAIRRHAGERGRPGRAYLADLAKHLNMPLPALSRTMERLQDKGLVTWKTDRNAGATYVKLTSKAVELMEDEHRRLSQAYRRIREEIDSQELESAMKTVKKITAILRESEPTP